MIFSDVELCASGPISIRWQKPDGSFHRESRNPGASVTDLPADAQAKVSAHWTPERVEAWKAAQPVPEPERPPTWLTAEIAKLIDSLVAESIITSAIAIRLKDRLLGKL